MFIARRIAWSTELPAAIVTVVTLGLSPVRNARIFTEPAGTPFSR